MKTSHKFEVEGMSLISFVTDIVDTCNTFILFGGTWNTINWTSFFSGYFLISVVYIRQFRRMLILLFNDVNLSAPNSESQN